MLIEKGVGRFQLLAKKCTMIVTSNIIHLTQWCIGITVKVEAYQVINKVTIHRGFPHNIPNIQESLLLSEGVGMGALV